MLPVSGSNRITAKMRDAILADYRIGAHVLIGKGSEAEAYALGAAKVLKVYPDTTRQLHLEGLKRLFHDIDETPSGLAVPRIQEIATRFGALCVVENRIAGVSLDTILPKLSPQERRHAEELYFRAAAQVSRFRVLREPTAFLLFDSTSESITSGRTWPQYYSSALGKKLQALVPVFARAIPDIATLGGNLVAAFSAEPPRTLSLVHGDFFPGNLMVHPDLSAATGVIDFGLLTVFGNSALDIASAFGFYRMYESNRQYIRDSVEELAASMLPGDERSNLYRYLLSHAIMTSDLYAQVTDLYRDGHFVWAVEILSKKKYWERADIGV